jgi:glycosyltransferase involved in cell wall biosynthesis
MTSTKAPFLSAIVISQNNAATISRTLASVVAQDCPRPFEVILVDSGSDETVEIVRSNFPEVIIVDLPDPVLPGKARNEGLKIARGDYVSFPGSHVELLPGSLAARMAVHEQGYALVTGAFLNGTDTLAGWASYFIDHAASLPGRPSGPLSVPPNSCSYDRRMLLASGLFPEDRRAGEDTVVNQRLWDAGHRAYRDHSIRLTHITRCRTPWRLVVHHFSRGQAWGRILAERHAGLDTLGAYLRRRLGFIDDCVRQWGGDLADRYRKARPLIRMGVTSAWLGAQFELATRLRAARERSQPGEANADSRSGSRPDEAKTTVLFQAHEVGNDPGTAAGLARAVGHKDIRG